MTILTQGSHTRDGHRHDIVTLLQVMEAKHMVSKKAVSPCEKKNKSCRVDKEARERNCKSSDGKLLMPSLWETASRQK